MLPPLVASVRDWSRRRSGALHSPIRSRRSNSVEAGRCECPQLQTEHGRISQTALPSLRAHLLLYQDQALGLGDWDSAGKMRMNTIHVRRPDLGGPLREVAAGFFRV